MITNYPEDRIEYFELPNNPNDEQAGKRKVPFTRELYIDRSDFEEVPPPKFFRMKPGGEVRLMGAYIVRCEEVVKNEDGSIAELRCTADLETGAGMPQDGRKIKGTIHWLSAKFAKNADIMLYDRLFTIENVADIPEDQTYNDYLNPDSLKKLTDCKIEETLCGAAPGTRFQFVRCGYFVKDTKYENTFNRIVGLKDSYPKKQNI